MVSETAEVLSRLSTEEINTSWSREMRRIGALNIGDVSILSFGVFGASIVSKEEYLSGPLSTNVVMFELEDGNWRSLQIPGFEDFLDGFCFTFSITSADLTGDGAIDYLITSSPHVLVSGHDCAEQHRSWSGESRGVVYTGHSGTWERANLETSGLDSPVDGSPMAGSAIDLGLNSDGLLLGKPACVRDSEGSYGGCPFYVYRWQSSMARFQAVEATKRQVRRLPKLYCESFKSNEDFPLVRCNEGLPITEIQKALSEYKFNLEIDGYFGDATRLAIQLLQVQNGFNPTGEVDQDLWRFLTAGRPLPGEDADGDGVISPSELSKPPRLDDEPWHSQLIEDAIVNNLVFFRDLAASRGVSRSYDLATGGGCPFQPWPAADERWWAESGTVGCILVESCLDDYVTCKRFDDIELGSATRMSVSIFSLDRPETVWPMLSQVLRDGIGNHSFQGISSEVVFARELKVSCTIARLYIGNFRGPPVGCALTFWEGSFVFAYLVVNVKTGISETSARSDLLAGHHFGKFTELAKWDPRSQIK